jgi:hypothetical protein
MEIKKGWENGETTLIDCEIILTWGNFRLVFGKWIRWGKTSGWLSKCGTRLVNIDILLSEMVVAACEGAEKKILWVVIKKKEIVIRNCIIMSKWQRQTVTWIEYTAESYRMWNVKNSDINMTDRKRAANLGRETPTIIKQSDSGPAGITEALDNHL